MTIKLEETYKIPFTERRFRRKRTLEPGYEGIFIIRHWNEDARGIYIDTTRIKVLGADSVEVTVLSIDITMPLGAPSFRELSGVIGRPYTVERENINGIVNENWGGGMKGRHSEKAQLSWGANFTESG